jgi:Tol biopolymer transport system component
VTTGTAGRMSFGPYQILSALGRGGMGEVYRAWDPRLEREVALKLLREGAEMSRDRVQLFIAEARAASALNHPNIITVYDAAVDEATPFIVTELIDGEPLSDQLRAGPLPLKRLMTIAADVADGLAEAHAAGIVHRDLKPDNVMITRGGRVKILDFGLARHTGLQPGGATAAHDDQTLTGPLLAGTIAYMSPEAARGQPTDFRTDQFSFGLILYEMAAGRPALRRATPAETLEAICGEEPTPLPAIVPQAPLVLWWIIERCLSKNPSDRYAVTTDLHRDLRMLRDRLGDALARESRPAQGGAEWGRTHRLAVSAALIALAAGVAIGARVLAVPAPPDLASLRFTPLATEAAYEGLPSWSPDGQTIAYAADVDGVLQIFTRRLDSSAPAQVTRSSHDAKHPFWSHDGRRLYYVAAMGYGEGIWSIPAAGGVRQPVVESASRGTMSPDGRTLAFFRDERRPDGFGNAAVWLANSDGSGERRYRAAPFGELYFIEGALAFSPDGRTLGVCAVPTVVGLQADRRGWQFWLLPMSGGPPVRRFDGWGETAPRVSSFAWRDKRHVVLGITIAGTPSSQLWLADLETDRRWPLTRSADNEYYPSASPSGDRIAFTRGDSDYDLVEIPLGRGDLRTPVRTSRNEIEAAWMHSGAAYAYVTDRAGQDEIWLRTPHEPADDRPIITQDHFPNDRTIMLGSPTFSPDGRLLAYQRNASAPMIWPQRIWYTQVPSGPSIPLLPPAHEGYQGAPTWSPDSQWLAFSEWNGREWRLVKVRVGGTDLPEPPVVLRTDGVGNTTPRWSPAGDWITWETEHGLVLVSVADGTLHPGQPSEQMLAHAWSNDGERIYGIRQDESGRRLELIAMDRRSGQARTLRDLGPSPPVNNPVKGLSLHPDGRSLLTSIVRLHGDVWVLDGFRPPPGPLERLRTLMQIP